MFIKNDHCAGKGSSFITRFDPPCPRPGRCTPILLPLSLILEKSSSYSECVSLYDAMRIFSERFHNLPLSSFLWAFHIHFAAAKGVFLHAAMLMMLARLEPLPDPSLLFRSAWNAPVPPERGTNGSLLPWCQNSAPIFTTSSLLLSFHCPVRSLSLRFHLQLITPTDPSQLTSMQPL